MNKKEELTQRNVNAASYIPAVKDNKTLEFSARILPSTSILYGNHIKTNNIQLPVLAVDRFYRPGAD